MKCNQCGADIEPGEERKHQEQIICEDCYMDALSPIRTCDPWAIYTAKSFENNSSDSDLLTPVQTKILSILKQTGGVESRLLLEKLNNKLTPNELERELATLHHMEKIGGERKNELIIWRLWVES